MKDKVIKILKGFNRFQLFSPRGFAIVAVTIIILFAIMHICGLREYTSILSSTSPSGNADDGIAFMLAGLYLFLYFSFVLFVPILIIALPFFIAFQLLFAKRCAQSAPETPDPNQ